MNWLVIIALTASSSIDNLGVGLSYGVRKVNIRMDKNLLISLICFLFSYVGISFGIWVANILPGAFPVIVGALFLAIIGIRVMILAKPSKKKVAGQKQGDTTLDNTEPIGFGESAVLGIALSANALTNGVGAGLIGFSPAVISLLAAIGSFFTIWAGVRLGSKVADIKIGSYTVGQFGTALSGILIIVVAVMVFL